MQALKAELQKYKNASVEPIDPKSPSPKKVQLASPEKEDMHCTTQSPNKSVRQPTIKYKKVLKEDITDIINFLRLKLISNYTSIKDIGNILNTKAVDGELTIKSLE